MERKVKIDGVPCYLVLRGSGNGEYRLLFQRPEASLERIEAINWARPHLSGPCELPSGYGFELTGLDYAMGTKTFTATVRVKEQYLGDVTGYQSQIEALKADRAALTADKAALERELAEADETAIALYEELAAAQADEDSGEVQE